MSVPAAAGTRRRTLAALVPRRGSARRAMTLIVAGGLGAGVPLSGFTPFNSAPDLLGMAQQPILVLLTPAVLLGGLALAGAVVAPAAWSWHRDVKILAAGGVLLVIGFALSLLSTDDVWYSILIGATAVLAPAALAVGVARSAVPAHVVVGCFLLACCLMLVRADLVFVQLHGLPSPATLYEVKFLNRPYDFHYYTLANPNGTAAWLLMPLAVALFSACGAVHRRTRIVLVAAAVLIGGTLILAYSRSAIAAAILLVVGALAALPIGRPLRYAVIATFVVGVVAFALAPTNRDYLSAVVATDPLSSGGERVTTTVDGLRVALDHPLTGVGLGRYNLQTGYVPAHTSIAQAAAEMGVFGALGMLLVTIGSVMLAIRLARAHGCGAVRVAAAIAAAAYLVFNVFIAGASEGLYSGYVSVWGLTVALLLGLAGGQDAASRHAKRQRVPSFTRGDLVDGA